GTLILVSHDRWFVSRLANRIVEITPGRIVDYGGSYEEYVHSSGDDHLDADAVILKARREKRQERQERRQEDGPGNKPRDGKVTTSEAERRALRRRLQERLDELTERIHSAESRIADIDATFCLPGYYDRTPPDEVATLDQERTGLKSDVERLMGEWEDVERRLGDAAEG
ncbi:MAG TPA: hypothetical protein VGA70_01570, partial [Longimicrobiales bacterium]